MAALRAELDKLRAEKATSDANARQYMARARTAEMANMSAQERALVSDQEANESKIESMESELQSMEDEIARLADEPGHGKEIAALNRKMAVTSAKLETEQNRKAFLAGEREKFKKQSEAPAGGDDRVLANGSKLSGYGPKTQAWLEAHPRAFSDNHYLQRAIIAAQEAVNVEGIADQSPEYFAHIEKKLGETKQSEQVESDDEDGEEEEEIQAPVQERYTPEKPQGRAAGPGSFAAAPARQVPHGSGSGNRGGRQPALSAEEREVALALYSNDPKMSDADKLKAYADGKRFMAERVPGYFRN